MTSLGRPPCLGTRDPHQESLAASLRVLPEAGLRHCGRNARCQWAGQARYPHGQIGRALNRRKPCDDGRACCANEGRRLPRLDAPERAVV